MTLVVLNFLEAFLIGGLINLIGNYNVLVSARQQRESAVNMCMSPPSQPSLALLHFIGSSFCPEARSLRRYQQDTCDPQGYQTLPPPPGRRCSQEGRVYRARGALLLPAHSLRVRCRGAVPACLTAAFLTGPSAGVPALAAGGRSEHRLAVAPVSWGGHDLRWRPRAPVVPLPSWTPALGPEMFGNSRNLREQPGMGTRVS